ncbi:LOW QUALITY PROTEIN: hypothetical protein V2J09_001537 [Rumex salicifolius]
MAAPPGLIEYVVMQEFPGDASPPGDPPDTTQTDKTRNRRGEKWFLRPHRHRPHLQNRPLPPFLEKLMQGFPLRLKAAIDDTFLMSKIRIERPGGEDGMPSITIDHEALDCLAKGWRHTVVIKLLGKPLAFHVMDRKIREMWKPTGNFVIVDLPNGYTIGHFEKEHDFYVP